MLDESGILNLEKVEAHFEKSPEQVKDDEQSTFQSTNHPLLLSSFILLIEIVSSHDYTSAQFLTKITSNNLLQIAQFLYVFCYVTKIKEQ